MIKRAVVVIILLIVLGFLAFIIYVDSMNLEDTRKVNIKGKFWYNLLSDWQIEYTGADIYEDSILPWSVKLWFGDTHDMVVKVKLTNQQSGFVYTGETNTGVYNTVVGGDKLFTVSVYHVPPGDYDVVVELWEIQHNFIGSPVVEWHQATDTGTLTVT